MNAPKVPARPFPDSSDALLWSSAQRGDPRAFEQIVERHQSMVCAVTYAGVGDLALSQDLAQETFVVAWKRLGSLREPDQLRAWLCGIARTLAANARRRRARRGGETAALDAIAEPDAAEISPLECAIARDEAALLDRALANVPAAYREVLVLFYREDQSVADVAAKLALNEAAVRQRLSRGRGMLREEVTALVESALSRTRPASSFTVAVLAAIAVAGPTTGTIAGASGAMASGAAVSTKAGAGLGAVAVAGPIAGLATAWLASRLVRAGARTTEEAQAIGRHFRVGVGFAFGMVAILLASIWLGRDHLASASWWVAIGTTVWTAILLGGFMAMQGPMRREIAGIRGATKTTDAEYAPELIRRGLGSPGPARWETRARLFGLPLVSFASGGLDAGDYSVRGARGWIAIGDLAISPLLGIGGVAVAPIAIGGATAGILSLSIGGLALGWLSIGSLAFGWYAIGIVAVAWRGAIGAPAIAHDYALGPGARAIEANTATATAWFQGQWFAAPAAIFVALIPILVLLSIVIPLALLARRAWRMRDGQGGPASSAVGAAADIDAAAPAAPSPERLHALDALRAVSLLLGLLLHSVLPYVLPPGFWAVGTASPVGILGWLAHYLHSFRLETFFLLAGFFGALIVHKRGLAAWIRDRAVRVLLVFLVALVPVKLALAAVWIWGGRATGWLVLPEPAASLPLWTLAVRWLFEERWPAIVIAHLWFLYYLAIVSACWAVAWLLIGRFGWLPATAARGRGLVRAVLSSRLAPLWLALATTPILTLMTGPDIDTPDRSLAWHLPVLALYGVYFAIGWGLHGARDLFPILASRWARLLIGGLVVSFVSAIGVGLRLEGGPWALANAQALRWGGAFAVSLAMASSVLGWIGAFVRFCGTPSATMRYLSDASYWIYVIHLPVMTALQVWWAGSGLPWWLQVPLVNLATLAVSLATYRVLVRSTWVGAWINGVRR